MESSVLPERVVDKAQIKPGLVVVRLCGNHLLQEWLGGGIVLLLDGRFSLRQLRGLRLVLDRPRDDGARSCCLRFARKADAASSEHGAQACAEMAYLWPLEPEVPFPFRTAARYFPVYELGSLAIASGVPAPTT